MPELQFKGKEFVYNHHLTVPFRPLEIDAAKGIGAPALDGNLIIHGDNLHALKALLPTHAGKVDCIFIDPPYNTGNEGWAYNDNVNSPMIREWLSANPIGVDDGLRHDKWACMMWPRLKLLFELLSDNGVLLVSIGDDEQARLTLLLYEIFGEGGFLSSFVWRRRIGSSMSAGMVSRDHEYVVGFSKNPIDVLVKGDERDLDKYSLDDGDGRKYASMQLTVGMTAKMRPNQWFELVNPRTGKGYWPPEGRVWGYYPPTMKERVEQGRILFPDDFPDRKMTRPRLKAYPEDAKRDTKPTSTWIENVGRTEDGTKLLQEIFGEVVFPYPKPLGLAAHIIDQFAPPGALVLDSFAGSGTTAHAVLAANARDGGNRRFILVEGEDYADTLTAERVRRVINGYSFTGTQREELLREPLTFSKLRNANALLEKVQGIETLDGPKYDRIGKAVKDGALIVTGERDVAETTPGLGGGFTYCSLGAPIEMDAILSGEALPSLDAMAGLLWHTATAQPFDPAAMAPAPDIGEGVVRLGEFAGRTYWLFYRDDLDWLKSGDAALSLSKARAIAATAPSNHLVFAPAKFVSRDLLAREGLNVEYAPLPFALYRLETA